MIACILILLLFSPIVFLTILLKTYFSPEELSEMGISLENGNSAWSQIGMKNDHNGPGITNHCELLPKSVVG
jgi:hypothetical protein